MAVILLALWFPRRKSETPFQWRWSIIFISIFLCAADFVYFYALSLPDAMVSIVSMVRRSSVIVSFTFGALLFKEHNIRGKVLDLALVLLSLVFLWLGSE
ncbi:MAG: EamA family transporter, partial [Candidatus Cryptobacteroides sp.]|nr:EamA family transporter [Candidatus Cryptobacteroides sp.]